jgi:hypothetical protein
MNGAAGSSGQPTRGRRLRSLAGTDAGFLKSNLQLKHVRSGSPYEFRFPVG